MSLPLKKRGFRRIVVENIAYDWFCEGQIDIRRAEQPRSPLFIEIVSFDDPWKFRGVTPAFIAYAIQEITRLGWEPEGYKPCTAVYESGKFTLTLPANLKR